MNSSVYTETSIARFQIHGLRKEYLVGKKKHKVLFLLLSSENSSKNTYKCVKKIIHHCQEANEEHIVKFCVNLKLDMFSTLLYEHIKVLNERLVAERASFFTTAAASFRDLSFP